MSTLSLLDRPDPPAPADVEVPRSLDAGRPRGDRVFRRGVTGVGAVVLVVMGAIGVFLGYQMIPTLHRYGLRFFTEAQFVPERNKVGVASAVLGTVEVAVIAIVVSFPLALLTALYISQYAPRRLRSTLVAMVDLMAAVPSIVYGFAFFFLLEATNNIQGVARFLHAYFGFVPIFNVNNDDPHAANWSPSHYTGGAFVCGLVVSLMVIPISAAVMRGVFDETPAGEREAALALGATRWGMVRAVVLPFGRSGIIGGTMLGLGRALGETVAVTIVFSQAFEIKLRPLEQGTNTISALIATRFSEASGAQLKALLAAGFVLFLMTLVVNTVAGAIVARSRSGATTDL